MNELNLLIVTDLHYTDPQKGESLSARKTEYAAELLTRVINRAIVANEKVDALVITGDILDNGLSEDSRKDLFDIGVIIEKSNMRTLIIPGNHDGDPEKFLSAFPARLKPVLLNNFILYPFIDSYTDGDCCERDPEDLKKFQLFLEKHPGREVIVFQHNPLYPPTESDYPYNLTNAEDVINFYEENKVILSVGGHYHDGKDLVTKNSTAYLTVPAICEEPFSYSRVKIKKRTVEAELLSLKNTFPIADHHCHTEFAYCGEDITAEKILKRAELLGLQYVCFTEHAGQLYLSKEDYWKHVWMDDSGILKKSYAQGTHRMNDFKTAVKNLSSPIAKTGLEIETDRFGRPTLLEEDMKGLDIIIGSVHFLKDDFSSKPFHLIEKDFMDCVEKLIETGLISVFAHPFRFFHRNKLDKPVDLYKEVAGLLKAHKIAAELNIHHNGPDLKFFRMCMDEGVKISLGTDSHSLLQTGEFYHHIKFLEEAGVKEESFPEILFRIPEEQQSENV